MSETEYPQPGPASPFRKPVSSSLHNGTDLLEEAEQKRLWVYHPQSENWYSPAEFREKYGDALREDSDFCRDLRLCRPEEGLQTLRRMLKEATEEMNQLSDKVISYYRSRATPAHPGPALQVKSSK